MADNYLERKMEEHLSGGAPGYRPRVTPTGVRAGNVIFPFPVRRMLVVLDVTANELPEVAAALLDLRDSLVRALAATGSKVAFTESDMIARNRLAQTCGACGVAPGDTDVVSARWEGIDSVIGIGTEDVKVYADVNVASDTLRVRVRMTPGVSDTEAAVRAVLWCLVPGNTYLLGSTIDI